MKTRTHNPAKIWDQIERQYLDTLAAAYGAPRNQPKSKRGAERLASLINQVEDGQDSILGQDGLALIAEIRGDLATSARHRLKSAELITQLLSSDYPLDDYTWDDVAERLTLAALDYDRMGEPRESMKCLRRAEAICRRHHLPFEGKDLADELAGDAVNAKATAAGPGKARSVRKPVSQGRNDPAGTRPSRWEATRCNTRGGSNGASAAASRFAVCALTAV